MLSEKLNYKNGISTSYGYLGIQFTQQGNYPEALKNYFAALKIREELGNRKDIARLFSNIGIVYDYQGNYSEALKNYLASLKLMQEIGDKQGRYKYQNSNYCSYNFDSRNFCKAATLALKL